LHIERVESKGIAQYSYVLISIGEAVVVDPRRDIDVYVAMLREKNLKLTAILETHIHADYASGARELAAATGAPMYLSAHDEGEHFAYAFEHRAMKDGDEVHAGDLRVVAYHTPGHTPEHLSFLVYEKSRCGQPLALFSGDFVFVGSLGRPDLLGDEAKLALAHQLYHSVHDRIEGLPDGVLVYPGHGAGSMCGANLSERPLTTLGYERFCNVFMTDQAEESFVEMVLATVPEFPDYYRRMKALNSAGAPLLNGLPGGRELDVAEFSALVDAGAVVVDLRRPEAFGGGHVAGSINIGAGPSFGLWAPWVVPYDKPLLLIGDGAGEARRALVRVGMDDIRGSLRGGFASWAASGRSFETIAQLPAKATAGRTVVDVRSPAEYALGHIEGAISMSAGTIAARAGELRGMGEVAVICGSGYRSSIAASLLKRAGINSVVNLAGGMSAYRA
jgi:hydroxyacylglutathione hydrolase